MPEPTGPWPGTDTDLVAVLGRVDRALAAEGIGREQRARVTNRLIYGHPDPDAVQAPFRCPRCGKTSYHPEDKRLRWCSACRWYTGDLNLSTVTGLPLIENLDDIDPVPPPAAATAPLSPSGDLP